MVRLLLIRHAATATTSDAVFGDDGPLAERGRDRARSMRGALPRPRTAWVSPAQVAGETALALGFEASVAPALADWDSGSWRGRAITDVEAREPDALAAWRTDPDFAPTGGESLRMVLARVAGWMDEVARGDGTVAAVTHSAIVRAALVHALGSGSESFWRLDVAPTSVTELRGRAERWQVTRTCWEPALIHVGRPKAATR